jgi:hypothetical protein
MGLFIFISKVPRREKLFGKYRLTWGWGQGGKVDTGGCCDDSLLSRPGRKEAWGVCG